MRSHHHRHRHGKAFGFRGLRAASHSGSSGCSHNGDDNSSSGQTSVSSSDS